MYIDIRAHALQKISKVYIYMQTLSLSEKKKLYTIVYVYACVCSYIHQFKIMIEN